MDDMDDKNIKISDLPLAAFLSCRGCRVIGVAPVVPSSLRFHFIFENTADVKSVMATFYSRPLIHPIDYYNSLKELKIMIFSKRDRQ